MCVVCVFNVKNSICFTILLLMQTILYRYRLYPNNSFKTNRICIEKHTLSAPEGNNPGWTYNPYKIEKLSKYVRTKDNPDGPVEYEEYDPLTREILYKPNLSGMCKMHSRDELFTYDRQQLEKIADNIYVNHIAVKDNNLIKAILQEQSKYIDIQVFPPS